MGSCPYRTTALAWCDMPSQRRSSSAETCNARAKASGAGSRTRSMPCTRLVRLLVSHSDSLDGLRSPVHSVSNCCVAKCDSGKSPACAIAWSPKQSPAAPWGGDQSDRPACGHRLTRSGSCYRGPPGEPFVSAWLICVARPRAHANGYTRKRTPNHRVSLVSIGPSCVRPAP